MGFAMAVLAECNELNEDEVLDDIWARDHTLWKEDPAEISDRLGWLDVADQMQGQLKSINEFARKLANVGRREARRAARDGWELAGALRRSPPSAAVPYP